MYRLDLRDALWGDTPIGGRRLAALVFRLPAGSSTAQAQDPNDGWSQQDELLATVVDMISENSRILIAANSEKGSKLPQPIRFPRPWEEEDQQQTRAQSAPDDVRAFFKDSDMNEVAWSAGKPNE